MQEYEQSEQRSVQSSTQGRVETTMEPVNVNLGVGVMANTYKHQQSELENVQIKTHGGVESMIKSLCEQHDDMQVGLQDVCGVVTLGRINASGFVIPDLVT
jgi:hypothetical protein